MNKNQEVFTAKSELDVVQFWAEAFDLYGSKQLGTQTHTQTHIQTLLCWKGEKIKRVKVRNSIDWVKGSLIGKLKAAHTSKAHQGIHSLPLGRHVFSHPQESWALSQAAVTWQDKCHTQNVPLPLWWAWPPREWNIPLVSWDQPSWLCPFPTSHVPAASLQVGQCKKQKSPWQC